MGSSSRPSETGASRFSDAGSPASNSVFCFPQFSQPGRDWREKTSIFKTLGNLSSIIRYHSSGFRLCSRAIPSNRSEEHTSELQSLLSISSAVYGLKKKKKTV